MEYFIGRRGPGNSRQIKVSVGVKEFECLLGREPLGGRLAFEILLLDMAPEFVFVQRTRFDLVGMGAFPEIGLVLEFDGVVECRPYSQYHDVFVPMTAFLEFKAGVVAEVLLEPHYERSIADLFLVGAKCRADDFVGAVMYAPDFVSETRVMIGGGIGECRYVAPLSFGLCEVLLEFDVLVFGGKLREVLYEGFQIARHGVPFFDCNDFTSTKQIRSK